VKATLVRPTIPPPAFERFAVQLDIDDEDQLIALTVAAGRMTNSHGLELYDLLSGRCEALGLDYSDPHRAPRFRPKSSYA